jgi:hypothetical protein
MTFRDDRDALQGASGRLVAESRRLRDVSSQLLAAIDAIHQLELEARRLAIGTREFYRVSAEVTALSRDVSRLAGEQERAAAGLPPRDTMIEDLERQD